MFSVIVLRAPIGGIKMTQWIIETKNLIPTQLVLDLVIIFVLNLLSTTTGTLKSLFVNRKIMKPAYFTTFLDAIICGYAVKLIASSTGVLFLSAYAMGRIAGVFLGDWIDNKLSLGALEITIYKNLDNGIQLADELRALGFSVTTGKGFGVEGKERLVLTIILLRKELQMLQEVLGKETAHNMVIRSIDKATGKILARPKTI